MQTLLGLEGVLKNAVRVGERLVGVAAPQVIVERNIGALAALQMFQIGKRAGRTQHLVHQRVRLHCSQLVIDGRQLVVFGRNQLCSLLRDVRIARQNGRDRLADIANLVKCEDRLIAKGRAVIGLGNELANILAGHDAMYAGERPCGRGVDAPDDAVRHGRAGHLAVQHARQAQIMRVFGAAANFGAGFQARQLSADLLHGW
jgi:hypothetical protein